tara:strand:- start:45037 stop:46818 length:1782 start_codon:yes stop_codon:yes gene_type:complete
MSISCGGSRGLWRQYRLLKSVMPALIASLLCGHLAAQDGQYRSKILLDPVGELGQGSQLSIDELEQQISSITDPYAKSSAGRHLARHYVEAKDYGKAVAFYREALGAEGLSDIANRQMLRELAQVYLLDENFVEVAKALEAALKLNLVAAPEDYLLLAQAYYRQSLYVAVVETLERLEAGKIELNAVHLRQALALYYGSGAYPESAKILRRLVRLQPHTAEYWHQLTAVYLQQNQPRRALDNLVLAREKAVPFTPKELMLLIDLQAANGNPLQAAQELEAAIVSTELPATGENYRKLFELWLMARERDEALVALDEAARLSGDTQLFLYRARLLMEDAAWSAMFDTMQSACAQQLQDKYVGQANLLLGISQLKLGDRDGARRSFINATLIGGATAQAGQWLDYMQAEPTTEDEARRIVGLCYGSEDKQRRVNTASKQHEDSAPTPVKTQIAVNTAPAMRYFTVPFTSSLADAAAEVRSAAVRLNVALVKSGGSADGPLQLLSPPVAEEEQEDMVLAMPVRGAPRASGRYRVQQRPAFSYVATVIEQNSDDLERTITRFAQQLQDSGLTTTGEWRLVFNSASGVTEVELRLGVE